MTHVLTDAVFWKHRAMEVTFKSDFAEQLASGAQLSSADSVTVSRASTSTSGEWDDHTDEFGSPNALLDGTERVQYTLDPAGQAAHQAPGMYMIKVEASADNGDTLVDWVSLEVFAEGDIDFTA